MNDDHRHTDLPRPMPDGTRRSTAGIYRESIRNEQLGLLPGDVKQVKEVMSSKVTTATPRTSLTEAAGLMKKLDVPVVVVYDGARLKGMLTERDMALSQAIQRASPKAAIERFMRTSIPPCFDDDLLRDALDLMHASKLEWLPVLDRRHRLVGVLPIYVPQP